MKISRQRAPVVFAVLMSCLMTFIVTCLVTLVNTGLTEGFVLRWMSAFALAWPVACICILLFADQNLRIVALITSPQ